MQYVGGQIGAMALPLAQLGIGRTSPLTAQIIRALGPVFVFALEQLDGRLHYSLPTLACILFYSASVIVSNIAHGWTDESVSSKGFRPTPQAVTRAADDRVNSAISAVGTSRTSRAK